MSIQIVRSTEAKAPSLVMCIYSMGGVGKTTLATTAPKPIFLDAENGTKALGARGIDVPIINLKSWADVAEAWGMIKDSKEYETVVIDPIGSFLDLLVESVRGGADMNLKKWGEAKDRMRRFIITVKDSGKHVAFIAHEKEEKDDDQVLRRPMLQANLWQELVNLCDGVGHLRVDAQGKRLLRVQPEHKYYAKDRFDALGDLVFVPDISESRDVIANMIKTVHTAYDKPPFEDKPVASTSSHAEKMKKGIDEVKQ